LLSEREPRNTGESRPRRSSAGRVHFASYDSRESEPDLDQEGQRFKGFSVQHRYSKLGKLALVNSGPVGQGFRICRSCGFGTPVVPLGTGGAKRPSGTHETPMGKHCNGTLQTLHLGHQFITDVLELRFEAEQWCGDSMWQSLCYAILEGASSALEIKRDDMDGTLYHYASGQPPAIVLYDTVPGGAGHVREIRQELPAVLEAALRRVDACECQETTSCYECLRGYRNQYLHQQLARGPVRDFLKELLASIYGGGGLRVRTVPDRRLWLQEQLSRGEEVLVAARQLEAPISDDLPGQPSRNWAFLFRSLLEQGAHLKLALAELPKPAHKGGDASSNALLHELASLAAHPKVELYHCAGALPAWTVGVTSSAEEQRDRLLRWKGSEGVLRSLFGEQEVEVTEHPEEVAAGLAELRGGFGKWKRIAASDPMFSAAETGKVIWVPEGGTAFLTSYLAEHMPPRIDHVQVHDPYLLRQHQVDNLLELGAMFKERKASATLVMKVETADARHKREADPLEQRGAFERVAARLERDGIELQGALQNDRTMHGRWLRVRGAKELVEVYLDRGLDVYYPPERGVRKTRKCYVVVHRGAR
jgi:hypothetical protein